MGLAIVEFIVALEEAFSISIPDTDTLELRTPRDLVDNLLVRVKGRTEWTREEVAQVVEGLILKSKDKATAFTFDALLRDLFF